MGTAVIWRLKIGTGVIPGGGGETRPVALLRGMKIGTAVILWMAGVPIFGGCPDPQSTPDPHLRRLSSSPITPDPSLDACPHLHHLQSTPDPSLDISDGLCGL